MATKDEQTYINQLQNTMQVTKLLLADKEITIYQLQQEVQRMKSVLQLPEVDKLLKKLRDKATAKDEKPKKKKQKKQRA